MKGPVQRFLRWRCPVQRCLRRRCPVQRCLRRRCPVQRCLRRRCPVQRCLRRRCPVQRCLRRRCPVQRCLRRRCPVQRCLRRRCPVQRCLFERAQFSGSGPGMGVTRHLACGWQGLPAHLSVGFRGPSWAAVPGLWVSSCTPGRGLVGHFWAAGLLPDLSGVLPFPPFPGRLWPFDTFGGVQVAPHFQTEPG
ncbi:hypothetical protein NDU88_002918 [Pleurodeles waltl]|uniref:Uncharacterized protein n=1 Tax=Pleurodeles waltl TaxID=8319 RepID=A0AAV7VFT4_PLEWA|nr:hypothetical protein NDU88_002918 [Pleurodeles waltl]